MAYHLLTGATGLLGAYLVRDLSLARIPLAVLVRPSRQLTARQRIDALCAHWERQLGYSLPRPVVLVGDVGAPRLGLTPTQVDWVGRHCGAVIHNAASLTFVERNGEPQRSNVDGTRHVLDVCRAAGVGRLFHVSTAYICGLRQGRVYEHEVDVGQNLGNAYEVTKLASEQMVRAAPLAEPPTIFRPGIIVGDYHTGYTTTFHGFYTPLAIVHTLATQGPRVGEGVAPELLLDSLGLSGDEGKNFVPVDWVSAAMTAVVTSPAAHGQTYHLTPPERVTVRDMTAAIVEALADHFKRHPRLERKPSGAASAASDESGTQSGARSGNQTGERDAQRVARFREQMQVYRAYWRDDPQFDTRATTAQLPHLPCPSIDRAALLRLCRFALEAGFGWPRRPVTPAPFDADDALRRRFVVGERPPDDDDSWCTTTAPTERPWDVHEACAPRNSLVRLGLVVDGRGGGQWTLCGSHSTPAEQTDRHDASEVKRGPAVARITEGVDPRAAASAHLNAWALQQLLTGKLDVETALRQGWLLLRGSPADVHRAAAQLAEWFAQPTAGEPSSGEVVVAVASS